MTEKIMPREVQLGLNLILYELFHVDVDHLREMPPFGEKDNKYFSRFGDQKINKIGAAIEWALENEHYPFNEIYPRQSHIGNDLITQVSEFNREKN